MTADASRTKAIDLFKFLRELTVLRTDTVRTLDKYDQVVWFGEIPAHELCTNVFKLSEDDRSDAWLEVEQSPVSRPPILPAELVYWVKSEDLLNPELEFPPLQKKIALQKFVERTAEDIVESDIAGVENDELNEDLENSSINPDFFRTATPPEPILSQLKLQNIVDAVTSTPQKTRRSNLKKFETITELLDINDHPELTELWEEYVAREWKPWAEGCKQYAPAMKLYEQLFAIHSQVEKLSEQYELLFAAGCLSWKTASNQTVLRHVLTAPATMTFDAYKGVIKVSSTEGTNYSLEQDMLELPERPQGPQRKIIEGLFSELSEDFWNENKICELLETYVKAISARGHFSSAMDKPTGATEDPKLSFAPAIILRKRSERAFEVLFDTIINQLEEGQEIPLGVERLVNIIDDDQQSGDEESTRDSFIEDDEIYFPLPANPDQREIAQKLMTRQGILVQGPPGTGKSHTITNLVCHLLAQGKRVLVTSHTPRALSVLRDKFPDNLKALCVSVIGDDSSESRKALEDSVAGITARHNSWNQSENTKLAAELTKKISDLREGEQWIFNSLRSIKEKDTYSHPSKFSHYSGTSQEIARRVTKQTELYEWMPRVISSTYEPPFLNEDALELLALVKEFDQDTATDTNKESVPESALLTPKDFTELVLSLNECNSKLSRSKDLHSHESYVASTRLAKSDREKLGNLLDELIFVYQTLSKRPESFAKIAAQEITGDHDKKWRELLSLTREGLKKVSPNYREVAQRNTSGTQNRDMHVLRADAQALRTHLLAGGKMGFGPFKPKVVKDCWYLLQEVRVEGKLCQASAALDDLIEWIELTITTESLKEHWKGICDSIPASVIPAIATLTDFCEPLETGLSLHDKMVEIRKELEQFPALIPPQWDDLKMVKDFREVISCGAVEDNLNLIKQKLQDQEALLRSCSTSPNAHVIVAQLLQATVSQNDSDYHKSHDANKILWFKKGRFAKTKRLLASLETANPPLCQSLLATFTEVHWSARFERFEEAWNWVRAGKWIEEMSDQTTFKKLSADLEQSQVEIRRSLGLLASAKSWHHTFQRLSEQQRQHLISWSMAIRRIGKGTGKHAAKHRKDARKHMDKCRTAIPAWIMPIHKVVESIRPGSDAFDVVIIDEASQSGPEALFLLYLAKQIVVVGDDKQISPEFVGFDRASVDALRERYLKEIPHSDAIGVDHSLFDQAKIRYRGKIRLKEHFRCMPEIIQFSNNLCYSSDPLIPLRQYGGGRITPVVKTQYIQNGYIDEDSRNKLNIPEAQAVLNEIKNICADPRYEGKTIGVISLLNTSKQADYIESKLKEIISKSEIDDRKIRVGDSYVFQGDERDIILLSMVSAPRKDNRKIPAMAAEKDERRFNVAVSRARDQLILFHSVTLSDLSSKCVRQKLLAYCANPHVETTSNGAHDLTSLRQRLCEGYKGTAAIPEPFDSWFELDVFLRIAERGYRVLPQIAMNGYKIDLIVEGIRGRLAVECDGDRWHGPEQYDDDMARQRDLERCGMQFWRVRGSAFYHNPEQSLEDLWRTLERLAITPSIITAGDDRESNIPGQNNVTYGTDSKILEFAAALRLSANVAEEDTPPSYN